MRIDVRLPATGLFGGTGTPSGRMLAGRVYVPGEGEEYAEQAIAKVVPLFENVPR